ncbi:MAG: flagellar basal body P-ring formation chaperone FlgA [Gemmatimonadetes bacterium]|nr:flagellar basal body P-ring formation chaperone FlgA [Gemmatimonadota bacterium]
MRGRETVKVRAWLAACAALVLLALPGRAAGQSESRIAVAARSLPRGAVLQSSDIAYRPSTGAVQSTASRAEPAAGWVTRRMISEGEPLREPAVAPPPLIKAGDAVQVVYRDGSMELRVAGRAMNAAVAGGRVTVRVDTERRFEGVATAAGLVRLDSPSRSR